MLKTLSVSAQLPMLAKKSKNAALLATYNDSSNSNTEKSFHNIESVTVDALQNINPVLVLRHKYLIITNPELAIAFLAKKSL